MCDWKWLLWKRYKPVANVRKRRGHQPESSKSENIQMLHEMLQKIVENNHIFTKSKQVDFREILKTNYPQRDKTGFRKY